MRKMMVMVTAAIAAMLVAGTEPGWAQGKPGTTSASKVQGYGCLINLKSAGLNVPAGVQPAKIVYNSVKNCTGSKSDENVSSECRGTFPGIGSQGAKNFPCEIKVSDCNVQGVVIATSNQSSLNCSNNGDCVLKCSVKIPK